MLICATRIVLMKVPVNNRTKKVSELKGKSSCYQTISMMQKPYLRHKCKVPYYDENMMKMMSTHVSP